MFHSERAQEVFRTLTGYVIRVLEGAFVKTEVRLRDPGQCLAAIRAAKENGKVRLMVYAVGTALGEECMEPVDEEFLLGRMR